MPTVTKQVARPIKKKVAHSILDDIAPVSFEESLRMSIYGDSGTGKTTLACTFPKPLLLVGVGASKAEANGTKSIHKVKGVDFVQVSPTENISLVEKLEKILEHVGNGGASKCMPGKSYQTAVLDHATSMEDTLLAEILGLLALPAQKSWGMATRDQYGQCGLQTRTILRAFLDLPIDHVVILSQQRIFGGGGDDNEDNILLPKVGPSMMPKTTGWLNPATEYICQSFITDHYEVKRVKIAGKIKETRTKTKQKDYCLRTGPHGTFTTKFRVPKGTPLPEYLEDPDYDKIMQLIKGE